MFFRFNNFIFLVCTFDGPLSFVVASVRRCACLRAFCAFCELGAYTSSTRQRTLFAWQPVYWWFLLFSQRGCPFCCGRKRNNGRLDLWSGKVITRCVCAVCTSDVWTVNAFAHKQQNASFVVVSLQLYNNCLSAAAFRKLCVRVEWKPGCLLACAWALGAHGSIGRQRNMWVVHCFNRSILTIY